MILQITGQIVIPENEIEITAIRSQGTGGQNVNKVSTAIHLRFDINKSSLPGAVKERLFTLKDHRISNARVIVIKAQRYRSQDKNREDAFARLRDLIKSAVGIRKKRKPTKPTKAATQKRLDSKTKRSRLKIARLKVDDE